jgi:Flp pilus assembly protein TadD
MLRRITASCLWLPALFSATAHGHQSAETHRRQALALYRTHDDSGALRELSRALEIDPHYAEAWNDMGVIQRQQGDLTAAIRSFRNAIVEKPAFTRAIYNLALALEASHDVGGAFEQVRRVIASAPRMPQGHVLYGRLLADQNQLESARDEFRKALELDSSLASAHARLGSVLFKLGLVSEARRELQQAVRQDPNSADSAAMNADATQTEFWTWLSAILLGGLVLNALFGWWWADPASGLVMVPIIAREGLEGLRGAPCCAA